MFEHIVFTARTFMDWYIIETLSKTNAVQNLWTLAGYVTSLINCGHFNVNWHNIYTINFGLIDGIVTFVSIYNRASYLIYPVSANINTVT